MNPLQRLSPAIAAWWHHRQPRERRLLAIAGMVCAAALLAQLFWTAHHAVLRLKPAVTKLERTVQRVRVLKDEIEQGALPTPEDRKSGPPSAASLPPLTGLTTQALGQGRYRIEGTVQFNDWLPWLANLHHGSRIILFTASVKALQQGEVRIEAELEKAP